MGNDLVMGMVRHAFKERQGKAENQRGGVIDSSGVVWYICSTLDA
jgi:hypothetical protein